ncbi:VIT domain-containing protein [Niabella ginsengisoli]|uniref:VIT domain-containing protein n=1 Tax=Niabella ginsengisoli TaxID=522298 RepID=A0ABS9SQX5_9BACT|nr:VIT domain-containing protein [Niabella ginsengisoli]MCH5600772.1 hypothetical protein [Niabella ginsengisoli]
MRTILTLIFICAFLSSYSQMPTLKVTGETGNPVVLEKMNVDVTIVGNIATTNMTLSFKNSGKRVLEGELTFPMPEGVTVSRYALDINGTMREAVPVEKARATEIFESIEQRNVDPGLLEKVEGNNFRTRIFPFPIGGTRTITIGYEETLKMVSGNALQYHLPFQYDKAIAEFDLKVSVFATNQKPILVEQPDGSFSFSQTANAFIAELNKENYKPEKSLVINLPKQINTFESLIQPNTDKSAYFLINDFPETESRERRWGNNIGLLWDISLSGSKRDHKKELELLDKIIQQKQNLSITLGLLNDRLTYDNTYRISNGDWSALRKRIESFVYDGATDYSVLKLPYFVSNILLSGIDEILFFTDGMSSFGDNEINLNKPIHTITTSAITDYSVLKNISGKNGGQFINLGNQSVNQAFNDLSKEHLQFLGIEGDGVSEVYPDVHIPVSHSISISGLLQDPSKEIILLYGWGNKITQRKKIKLNEDANNLDVHRIWAQKKIAALDLNYEKTKKT